MSSGESPTRPTPLLLLRWSFFVFLGTLVVVVLTFLALFAASLYDAGRNNAVSKTAALEQYVRRSLEVSAVVAEDAREYLRRRGSVAGLAQDYDAHAYFSELKSRMSLGEGMIFVDADGTVVTNADQFPPDPVDLSDRTWFQAHVEGADRAIGGSFISRVTGTLIFVYTLAVRDEDGVLQGAVNIGIPSDEILGTQPLSSKEDGVVMRVVKGTGELIARGPFPDALIGARLTLPDQMQSGSAVIETRTQDGRRALTAYERIEDHGLIASVSIPLAVIFRPLIITAAIALPLLAVIVFAALAVLHYLESQQKQLQRGAIRLETVLQASSLGAWQWFPKIGRTDFLGRWADMLGYTREELAPDYSTWQRSLHPDEKEHLLASVARLLRGEQDEFHEEHRMRHKDGHWVWVLDSGRVVERDAKGNPEVVIGIHLDISERREAEERMRTVSREVDHRSKNLLAVVQALISMTKLDSEGNFKSTLRGRIQAMSRAHELLSRSRWKGADLRTIAEEELGAHIGGGATEIVIEGPSAVLAASAAQPLAMTLHELATNAAKYGALSVPGGCLRLTWSLPKDDPTFTILWEETVDRPPEGSEGSSGFGSRLMRLMIEEQLGGSLDIDWTGGRLRYRMDLPKSLLSCSSADHRAHAAARDSESGAQPSGGGGRLLLVEDEALLAGEMATRLEAAGYVLAGHASSLREASSAAQEAEIEAAVLDVNLRGEVSFPVADILLARGVPFVFVTGYQYDDLPDRFSHAPVVRKPSPPGAVEKALADAVSAHRADRTELAG